MVMVNGNWWLEGTPHLQGQVLQRAAAVLAALGNSQGTGAAIVSDIVAVTGADNTKGVTLPNSAIGVEVVVINRDATHTLPVYPDSGGAIAGGSANAAVTLAAGQVARFIRTAALTWDLDIIDTEGGFAPLASPVFTGNVARSSASPAAAGANQGDGAVIAADINAVTSADNAKGVTLPLGVAGEEIVIINTDLTHTLKVYPHAGGTINALAQDAALVMQPGENLRFAARSATQWWTSQLRTVSGQHQQAAAADTIITGLSHVTAVQVSFGSAPTVKQMFCEGDAGDQAGSPAAGSIILRTYKPTSNVNDSTPTASTDWGDNVKLNWTAWGY